MKSAWSNSPIPFAVALWLGLAGTASAGELCVTCQGPDATYRCTFSGSGDTTAPQLACIGELARQGGHKSCSLARNHQGPCNGQIREVAVTGGGETAPSPDPATAAEAKTPEAPPATETYTPAPESTKPPADHAADDVPPHPSRAKKNAEAPASDKPPRTVQELVEKGAEGADKTIEGAGEAVSGAAKSASNAVEKSGSAIGNAAKKTWKCLTSLFGEC